MYDIQLRKGGKLFVKSWSSRTNNYREKEVEYEFLSTHLHDAICFDQDIRLKDVFLLFRRNVDLFAGSASCPFLSDFTEEAMLPVVPSKAMRAGLGGIVVGWIASQQEGGNWHEDAHVYIYPTIHGVGLEKDFDLSVLKINEISGLPVVLDTTLEIVDANNEKVLFEGVKPFSLLEVSRAILDELGSNPPDLREFISDSYAAGIDSPDISEKISKCIEEHNKIIPCKICGEDTKSYHFGKPEDICGKCFSKTKEN